MHTPVVASSGYVIVPGVLDAAEILTLAAVLRDESLDRGRAGARHLMRHPAVRALVRDPRMLAIARGVLAAEPTPFRATLFDKSPRHNWLVVWHQDTALPLRERHDAPGWGPWSVKAGVTYAHAPATALSRVVALRLHLDDSCLDNGPLRVLPDTHAMGVLSDGDIQRLVSDTASVACEVPAGGVLAMRPLILHASSKAESDKPRCVLHIEYADGIEMGNRLELAIA